MIRFRYNPEEHECQIETVEDEPEWDRIYRHLSELSPSAVVGARMIRIPWHAFISGLRTIHYLVNKYNLEIDVDEETTEMIQTAQERISELENVDDLSLVPESEIQAGLSDAGFQRSLTPEQLRNLSRLLRIRAGATFSVPGAGKTTEAIAFYTLQREANDRLLVICPKNAFPAWEEQFSACFPHNPHRIIRLRGGEFAIDQLLSNPVDVFLITYQQFIRVAPLISRFLHEYPTFLFLDESHRIKGGEKSETGRQIQLVSHLPVGKLIMSGTPMPNRLEDLVPQYNFLFPQESNIDAETVALKIKRIYVRTTKSELGLREPRVIHTKIPFSEAQKNLYDLARSEAYRQSKGLPREDKRFYRRLQRSYMQLLQIVSNPALLMKNSTAFPDALKEAIEFGDSAKIAYAIRKARILASQGQKTLIWSGFVENVELISRKLMDLGAEFIHGGVEAGSELESDKREGKIKRFHDDPNCFVLVANPAACAEGISLHTVCHHAVYVDRNYNAAQYLQSMDRIHRLGLSPNIETTIEIVKVPDSIDDRVENRLKAKIDRMADVLNDDSLSIEPEEIDLDDEGFSEADAIDLMDHLAEE